MAAQNRATVVEINREIDTNKIIELRSADSIVKANTNVLSQTLKPTAVPYKTEGHSTFLFPPLSDLRAAKELERAHDTVASKAQTNKYLNTYTYL